MVYEDIDSLLRVRNVKMSSEINPADRGGEGPRRQREAIWMPKKRGRKGLRVLQFPEKPDTVVEGWVDIDKMRIPGNPWCLSRDLAMLYFEYRGAYVVRVQEVQPHHTLSWGAKVSRILRSSNLRLLAAPPELKEEVIKRIDLRLKRVEEVKAW